MKPTQSMPGQGIPTDSDIVHTTKLSPVQIEKKIGKTTYIATAGFNGDNSRDMVKSILRLIERDNGNHSVAVSVE